MHETFQFQNEDKMVMKRIDERQKNFNNTKQYDKNIDVYCQAALSQLKSSQQLKKVTKHHNNNQEQDLHINCDTYNANQQEQQIGNAEHLQILTQKSGNILNPEFFFKDHFQMSGTTCNKSQQPRFRSKTSFMNTQSLDNLRIINNKINVNGGNDNNNNNKVINFNQQDEYCQQKPTHSKQKLQHENVEEEPEDENSSGDQRKTHKLIKVKSSSRTKYSDDPSTSIQQNRQKQRNPIYREGEQFSQLYEQKFKKENLYKQSQTLDDEKNIVFDNQQQIVNAKQKQQTSSTSTKQFLKDITNKVLNIERGQDFQFNNLKYFEAINSQKNQGNNSNNKISHNNFCNTISDFFEKKDACGSNEGIADNKTQSNNAEDSRLQHLVEIQREQIHRLEEKNYRLQMQQRKHDQEQQEALRKSNNLSSKLEDMQLNVAKLERKEVLLQQENDRLRVKQMQCEDENQKLQQNILMLQRQITQAESVIEQISSEKKELVEKMMHQDNRLLSNRSDAQQQSMEQKEATFGGCFNGLRVNVNRNGRLVKSFLNVSGTNTAQQQQQMISLLGAATSTTTQSNSNSSRRETSSARNHKISVEQPIDSFSQQQTDEQQNTQGCAQQISSYNDICNLLQKETLPQAITAIKDLMAQNKLFNKFVKSMSDLTQKCAPQGFFKEEPQLKQIWKFIKKMMEDYALLKERLGNDQGEREIVLLTCKYLQISDYKEIIPQIYQILETNKKNLEICNLVKQLHNKEMSMSPSELKSWLEAEVKDKEKINSNNNNTNINKTNLSSNQ